MKIYMMFQSDCLIYLICFSGDYSKFVYLGDCIDIIYCIYSNLFLMFDSLALHMFL